MPPGGRDPPVTEWGLFRHYWVSAKLLLTSIGTLILLGHMPAVSRMAGLAAGTHSWCSADFGVLPIQLVVHAAGGVLVLLAITTLSVFEP